MANIFAPGGEELLNKKDFDKKINIANSIGTDQNEIVNSENWSDIFGINTGTDWQTRLSLLKVAQTGASNFLYGNNSSAIFFGGGDTKGGLEVHYTDHIATIIGGNNPNIVWSERIAWKSDIDALKARISALEKQIGGVLSSTLNHLKSRIEVVA